MLNKSDFGLRLGHVGSKGSEVRNLGSRFQDSKNGKFPKMPFLRVRKKWVPGVIGVRSWMGFAGPRKLSKMRIVSGL